MYGGAGGESATAQESPWKLLEPAYRWEDLVLPEAELELLRSIASTLRARVPEPSDELRRGAVLLFTGRTGTGKTMAAQAIASELDAQVLELDLLAASSAEGTAIDDWIEGAFAAAQSSNSVLLLDGAGSWLDDSAPGTTSLEIDERHAQERVGAGPRNQLHALLDRSRGHTGAVIFTSTLTGKIDHRLGGLFDARIDFPFPSPDARAEIWRRSLPADAEVSSGDVRLMSTLRFTGGMIHACCSAAAALAADEGVRLQMRHVSSAVEAQYRVRPGRLTQLLERLANAQNPSVPSISPGDPARAKNALAVSRARQPSKPFALARARPNGVEVDSHAQMLNVARAIEQKYHLRPGRLTQLLERLALALGQEQGPVRVETTETFEPEPALAPVAEPPGPREPKMLGVRAASLAVGATAAAAVFGFALSRGGHPVRLDQHAAAGPVRISFPSGWRLQAAPTLPPLPLAGELAVGPGSSSQAKLVIGTIAMTNPSLSPQQLVAGLFGSTGAQNVKVGHLIFYRYPHLPAFGGRTSVYALPTTVGTVIGMCTSRGGASSFAGDCERALGTISLTSGSALSSAPSATYARALDSVITKLNAVRSADSARLRGAPNARAQASATTELALAHEQAATALEHLSAGPAGTANSALVAALRTMGKAYRMLARAAIQGNARQYSQAAAWLTLATDALDSSFAELSRLGYQVG